MFLFEKILIGIYCNWLYDLGQRHGPFSCYDQIKANSAGKNLNVTNINTKAGPPNHQICLPLNSSFLYQSKRPQFGLRHQFQLCFTPFTLSKITNGSLCHHSFVLNTSSLDLKNQHDHQYMHRNYGLY